MLTYRSHIYTLAMEASAKATAFGLSLARCVSHEKDADYEQFLQDQLPSLEHQAAELRGAVDKLMSALPTPVEAVVRRGNGLFRHMGFINRYISTGRPGLCAQDVSDIIEFDIPGVLRSFDRWYESRSPVEPGLRESVTSLVSAGELDSALRRAWVYFKTRSVGLFGLPDDLDGHRLVDSLFSDRGKTVGILANSEREAYLNLFKGLYVLSRNQVGHNDVQPDPEEFEAVLALINSTLVKLEKARSQSTATTG